MAKASETLEKVRKQIKNNLDTYVQTSAFRNIADIATLEFVKRVQRGFMPSLGKIPDLSENYKKTRNRYKGNLGGAAKVNMSNASATGQMLGAIKRVMTRTGFIIFVNSTSRRKELSGGKSKITNDKVAKFYSISRAIFDFSAPEKARIIRLVKADILKIVRQSKL